MMSDFAESISPSRPVSGLVSGLSYAIVTLAAIASGAGLLIPEVYKDNAWVTAQNRGTDLVTLVIVVPATLVVLAAYRRGSPRGRLMLFGLLGYFFYVYTGASLAYSFNYLFLVYVALFSLSIFALVALGNSMNAPSLRRAFDANTPWRAVWIFMVWLAVMLCIIWFSQILPFYLTGEIPQSILDADAPTMFVYVLDLGIVVPVAIIGAAWLRRCHSWGPVLAGFILVKATTIGLALLGMTWFVSRAGEPTDFALAILWAVVAVAGLSMSYWFFKHCRTVGNLTDRSRGR